MAIIKLSISILFILSFLVPTPTKVYADWPMAGHDAQRTSRSNDTANPTKACGYHAFADYIPSKSQIITSDQTNLVYVPTAAGVYAIKPNNLQNNSSDVIWFYATPRPVGHSPSIDKITNRMYIPTIDGTLHAVDASTGDFIWQSKRAGGSFVTSPLIANNLVYLGNRDSYFYAFSADTGALVWYFKTDGAIEFSAAIDPQNSIVYMASNDMHAYALNALNGSLIAKSQLFQGHGFHSFWPVYYKHPGQPERVLFPKAANYPENFLSSRQQEAQLLDNPDPIPVDTFIAYHNKYPHRETLLILDKDTLQKRETSPFLWWGNATGNRHPPVVDVQGYLWDLHPWYNTAPSPFGQGGFVGWRIGESTIKLAGNVMRESGDEPRAFLLINDLIGFGHGGDGSDTFGFASTVSSYGKSWHNANIRNNWGKWYEYWNRFKYGNWLNFVYRDTGELREWSSHYGSHGNQSPPSPLGSRAYIHRSNAVLCLE